MCFSVNFAEFEEHKVFRALAVAFSEGLQLANCKSLVDEEKLSNRTGWIAPKVVLDIHLGNKLNDSKC